MLPDFACLLICYGLMFGVANKIEFLHGRFSWLDSLLSCPYCLGFHTGYLVYLALPGLGEATLLENLQFGLAWAFASSAFCYAVDTSIRLIEARTSNR